MATQSESDQGPDWISKITVGIIIVMVPAILGYAVSFLQDLRKNQLDLVNRQIERLYGPMYALTQANDVTWKHFSLTNWPNRSRYYFDPKQPPTDAQVAQWRIWMRTVFQPMNIQVENNIVSNSQLIVGETMPKVFSDLIAETEAYKAIIATWTDHDASNPDIYRSPAANTVPSLTYPDKLSVCVSQVFRALKDRQSMLQDRFFSGLTSWTFSRASDCK